ncbi:uncharacterized protein DUF2586 [Ruminiclostridium sufflavum DSM 19573]|uniref:Uncharacterized protein DUF2586 n=1 Tax=Ruminiclostridium sufflavum DSM 19573 TaxID=1121337 RepID=A0A318XJM5_9FIRM|nr:DUF2586 domain-containing protein [Ruminiclostridium sufflavum]PYG86736.1 uncharacterized protein DUF2586 [Ruminiclostridium sufflavum DSM 19573]
MLRDVNTTITDGILGLATDKGDGIHLKIGVSPIESDTPIVITGNMTALKIKGILGFSPLADKVMDSVENGSSRIYCLPVKASTAGTRGTVEKTGTGSGTLTANGNPYNAFNVIIKITGQGRRNTALFVYSIDGGYSYSDEMTVPLTGEYEIPLTGLTVTFAEGAEPNVETSFLLGDEFKFNTTAPTMTNADVLAAIDKLKHFNDYYEIVHIVGESQKALWSAVSEQQIILASQYHKPLFFVLEGYAPDADETAAEYAQRLEADKKDIKNTDIQVVAARSLYIGMDGITREINNAGIVCGLYSKTAVHQSIGKTRDTAGMGIGKTKMLELRPSGIEEFIELLDSAKYLTFREYDGLDSFFVTNARVMSPEGSDYRYAEDVRVKNKIIREVRKEALQLLQDDIDLEDVQNELETRAKFMQTPLDDMVRIKEISSAEISVPEGQDILSTEKMSVIIRYVSRGYIREISVDLGRTKPSSD